VHQLERQICIQPPSITTAPTATPDTAFVVAVAAELPREVAFRFLLGDLLAVAVHKLISKRTNFVETGVLFDRFMVETRRFQAMGQFVQPFLARKHPARVRLDFLRSNLLFGALLLGRHFLLLRFVASQAE
jgi:hypothetical protein